MEKEDKNKESAPNTEDNRVIADMNIEGMPWYTPGKPLYEKSKEELPPLSKKETFSLTLNALAAALLIALIFLGLFALFILFCTRVWL